MLGAGGVGSAFASALCRLGVERLYIVDCDTVDTSNLNRQILFSSADVGRSKSGAAAERLQNLHSIRTEVVSIEVDVVCSVSIQSYDQLIS